MFLAGLRDRLQKSSLASDFEDYGCRLLGRTLSFAEEEQACPAAEANIQRNHAAWEKAQRRCIYSVTVIVAATVIALFAGAFMQPPTRFYGRVETGFGRRPSRWARLRASFRARRTDSAFRRALASDGFSKAVRAFISLKTPSRCIFFLRAFNAWSTLLSRTTITTI